MSEARDVRVLQVRQPGEVTWVARRDGPLADGCARLDTVASGVSAGTELTFLKGTNPAARGYDARLGLFAPPSGEGPEPHPSAAPTAAAGGALVDKLGYMQVGLVVASRSPHLVEGSRVAATYGHATGHDLDPRTERAVVLPPDLDPLLGVLVAHMGPICANGLLHAAADLLGPAAAGPDLGAGVRGRRVLVTGAGVVGLLSALMAAHHGALEVAVVDPTPSRRAAAEGLGLVAVDPGAVDVGTWAKERWSRGAGAAADDRGADVVLQCRGRDEALQQALRALRPQGVVVDLAFYPGGAGAVRLGEELHHHGLRLVAAQIGRVPRGLAHAWDRERLSAATLDLLAARGDDVRRHLVTDVVPFDEAPELYANLVARRRQVLQAVLTP